MRIDTLPVAFFVLDLLLVGLGVVGLILVGTGRVRVWTGVGERHSVSPPTRPVTARLFAVGYFALGTGVALALLAGELVRYTTFNPLSAPSLLDGTLSDPSLTGIWRLALTDPAVGGIWALSSVSVAVGGTLILAGRWAARSWRGPFWRMVWLLWILPVFAVLALLPVPPQPVDGATVLLDRAGGLVIADGVAWLSGGLVLAVAAVVTAVLLTRAATRSAVGRALLLGCAGAAVETGALWLRGPSAWRLGSDFGADVIALATGIGVVVFFIAGMRAGDRDADDERGRSPAQHGNTEIRRRRSV